MKLQRLEHDLTVCKLPNADSLDLAKDFYFIGRTDEEFSLVCRSEDVPEAVTDRDDGWKAFRIVGVLDFSLVGILSRITTILADNNIGIFAVSTFNTDYVLVKKENYERALSVLEEKGYGIS